MAIGEIDERSIEKLNAFPYVGINRIRFKGFVSILIQNTPKANSKIALIF